MKERTKSAIFGAWAALAITSTLKSAASIFNVDRMLVPEATVTTILLVASIAVCYYILRSNQK